MNRVTRSGITGGVLGFALGMAAAAMHCRLEVALPRALLAGAMLAAAGMLASSLNQPSGMDDESGGQINEDTT